ncbi:MAG: c-type cytochrome, partial [Desulfobacterales bacterium]
GRRVYKELRCANCHGVLEEDGWWRKIGPEFTTIGDKPINEINFGDSKVFRTLPDYIFEKIRNPQVYATKDNFMKMPKYDLSEKENRDITLALLSFNTDKVTVKDYRFTKKKTPSNISDSNVVTSQIYPSDEMKNKKYEPKGEFSRLVDKFRCFSCHSFKGRGYNITYDLSVEGSRVQRKWFYNYLKAPYSLRPILTIRMPIFKMTDEEIEVLTSGFMLKMTDPEIEKNLQSDFTPEMILKGKNLFEKKGCLACHQLGKRGGYVGPSFTQGAYVGDKLKAGWVFKWLKNPQGMKSDVLEPNYGLSDQDATAITVYLMSIKGPQQEVSKNGE